MEFSVLRSRRRTVSLEVRDDGSVLVRCPLRFPQKECERFVEEKREWILRQQARVRVDPRKKAFSEEEIRDLICRARETLIPMTQDFARRFWFDRQRQEKKMGWMRIPVFGCAEDCGATLVRRGNIGQRVLQ